MMKLLDKILLNSVKYPLRVLNGRPRKRIIRGLPEAWAGFKTLYHVNGYYGSYGGIRHKAAIWASGGELCGRGGFAGF